MHRNDSIGSSAESLDTIDGNNSDSEERLIPATESNQAASAVGRNTTESRCNISNFWIGSELAYNFGKVLALSTYALAAQITDIANMQSDYESIEIANTALYISLPIAVLFAASEAACHYAESTLISGINHTENNNLPPAPPAPLHNWQLALVAFHLLSDAYADAGSYLALAEIIGLKQQTEAVRYGVYAGLTVFSIWGNVQEARNAAKSFREKNGDALRMNASNV